MFWCGEVPSLRDHEVNTSPAWLKASLQQAAAQAQKPFTEEVRIICWRPLAEAFRPPHLQKRARARPLTLTVRQNSSSTSIIKIPWKVNLEVSRFHQVHRATLWLQSWGAGGVILGVVPPFPEPTRPYRAPTCATLPFSTSAHPSSLHPFLTTQPSPPWISEPFQFHTASCHHG